MEKITSRSCDYLKDQDRLTGFWLDCRAASDVRMYPTVWRIRLLLTSRVWNQEKDTQIWENESGQIIGFAMLWSRQPASSYIVLDSFAHPKFASNRLFSAILNWGDHRANEIAKEQKIALTVYVTGFSQYDFSARILKQSNYALLPPNPDEHNAYFSKSLQNGIPTPSVPTGYEIRKLQEEDDLEAYQAIYGFSKVNPLHQKELIESKEYCHLMMINPDGEFVHTVNVLYVTQNGKEPISELAGLIMLRQSQNSKRRALGRRYLWLACWSCKNWAPKRPCLSPLIQILPQ